MYIAALVLIAICIVWYAVSRATACPTTSYEVRGTSLDESAPPGSHVTVAAISCTTIHRGDLVLFNTPADPKAPVIKRAAGIPGDTFSIATSGSVIINGNEAAVPSGAPYQLTTNGITMLDLYATDYHHTIPPKSYLLLGDVPSGALDSSRLGLISLQEIVGVVTRVQK